MKTINLYLLALSAANLDIDVFSEYESYLAGRVSIKRHKQPEVETLVDFVDAVFPFLDCRYFDGFAFTYEIPQLGREFDLLKVSETGVLNIELKSQMTTHDKLKKQLLQNRHFLNHLQRDIYQFEYVKTERRFYMLDGDDLTVADTETIVNALKAVDGLYVEDLSDLFKPSQFLVSPLNTPEKFLNDEYFLTDSQEEVKNDIIDKIVIKPENEYRFFGITGAPGTGKTLLLYDIAKNLAQTRKVCVVHCGYICEGHKIINDNIEGLTVTTIACFSNDDCCDYDVVLFDETHRLYNVRFDNVVVAAKKSNISVIFSFDPRQVLSKKEIDACIADKIKSLDNFKLYQLKNKIRTNKEMASFIRHLMYMNDPRPKEDYKNVQVIYAANYVQANCLIDYYRLRNYQYVAFTLSLYYSCGMDQLLSGKNTHEVIGQEFDSVVMAIDDSFYYDESGHLLAVDHPNPDYLFKQLLFQGLTRVREKIALIVINNPDLFEKVIDIVSPVPAGENTDD